jgi:hypothetical protein
MDEPPTRRWFRFRLSTVLILTAIVAWGMACRPYIETGTTGAWLNSGDPLPPGARSDGIVVRRDRVHVLVDRQSLNPALQWPLTTLVAFLAWKAAWAVAERRRHKSVTPKIEL